MAAEPNAERLLEGEARALLTRLNLVKPFALLDPVVPAAQVSDAAQVAVERYLAQGRRELRARLGEYLAWLRSDAGRAATPQEQQRRLTFLRMLFNVSLSQMELFGEALSQRGSPELGVWLAGMDVAAAEGLSPPGLDYEAPPVMCYVNRAFGAAIRRARTRLPGGGENPVAIIRMPRERMVGAGIASSLMHEVGHQGAELLNLLPPIRALLARRAAAARGDRDAWTLWGRWISEIIADFWALALVGVASTQGLITVVSLPRPFVFRGGVEDPHPIPWIRVMLSCAIGEELFPHPQWRRLADVWQAVYPVPADLPAERRALLGQLLASMPEFVRILTTFQPPSLRGRTLPQVFDTQARTPAGLLRRWQASGGHFMRLRDESPVTAFAVLGQARQAGLLSPENEVWLTQQLLTYWALRRNLGQALLVASAGEPHIPARARVLAKLN
jgi:hypothetical protein